MNHLSRTVWSVVLVVGLIVLPIRNVLAAPQTVPPKTTAESLPSDNVLKTLSKQDLQELIDYGKAHGEDVSDLKAYVDGGENQAEIGGGLMFKIARKVLVLTLERGGPVLEKALTKFPKAAKLVKKYNPKIIKAINKLESAEDAFITKSLLEVGIEPSAAQTLTVWISYML